MKKFTLFLMFVVFLPVIARTDDPSLLTLERIFSSEEFREKRFTQARWLEDGSGYTVLDSIETGRGGENILRYNPETGESEILVSASQLIPKGSNSPLDVGPTCRRAHVGDIRSLAQLPLPEASPFGWGEGSY